MVLVLDQLDDQISPYQTYITNLMSRVRAREYHLAAYPLRLCKHRIVRMQSAYYIYVSVAAVRYVRGVLC